MIYPLPHGNGMPPDWFFVDTESCGGGAESLGLVLMVSIFIGFLALVSREGGPRGEHVTLGRAGGLARPGGLCPPRGSSGPPTKRLVPLLFQKKSSKSFGRFRELSFSPQKQHHGSSAENNVSSG